MPVGIDECKVRFEEPYWVVITIVEDNAGWQYLINASDGVPGPVRFVEYYRIAH